MIRRNLGKLFLPAFVITIILVIWIIKSAFSVSPISYLLPTKPTFSTVLESIPPYPNSKFLHNYRTTFPDDYPGNGAEFESDDDPQVIITYYENKLRSLGWTIAEYDYHLQEGVPLRLKAIKDQFKCYVLVDNTKPRRISIHISRL